MSDSDAHHAPTKPTGQHPLTRGGGGSGGGGGSSPPLEPTTTAARGCATAEVSPLELSLGADQVAALTSRLKLSNVGESLVLDPSLRAEQPVASGVPQPEGNPAEYQTASRARGVSASTVATTQPPSTRSTEASEPFPSTRSVPQPASLSDPIPEPEPEPEQQQQQQQYANPSSSQQPTKANLPNSPSEADITTAAFLSVPDDQDAEQRKIDTPTTHSSLNVETPKSRPKSPLSTLARLLPSTSGARSSLSALSGSSSKPRERHWSMPSLARPPAVPPALPGSRPQSHLPHQGINSVNRPEEIPFDFNLFLEQMKLKSAAPIGENVRSFLRSFGRQPRRLNEQVQLVRRYLAYINDTMAQTPPWSDQSPAEFENAKEAMEKLVMNRLYTHTFAPAIQAAGRSVQTDDLERDAVLDQKVRLFGWVQEQHLDLPLVPQSQGFIGFAVRELLKINSFKAPRDKLICLLNVCKVIFGLIRHLKAKEAGADTFLPLLILVVLRAQCKNLVSNVEYIAHFRSPDRLASESGYYLSSLQGAIGFIEQMDYSSLSNIPPEEFEHNVEVAAAKLAAETGQARPPSPPTAPQPQPQVSDTTARLSQPADKGDETSSSSFSSPTSIPQPQPQPQPFPSASSALSDRRVSASDAVSSSGPAAAAAGDGDDDTPTRRSYVPNPAIPASRASASPAIPTQPPTTTPTTPTSAPSSSSDAGTATPSLAEDTRHFFQRTSEAARAGIGRPMVGAIGRIWSDTTTSTSTSTSTTTSTSIESDAQANTLTGSNESQGKASAAFSPPANDMKPSSPEQPSASPTDTTTLASKRTKFPPSPLSLRQPSDQLGLEQQQQQQQQPPIPVPSSPPPPQPSKNRLLSIFGPSSHSGLTEPRSPGPHDVSFAAPDAVSQASSLNLPLPNWARSAMGRRISHDPPPTTQSPGPAPAALPTSTRSTPSSPPPTGSPVHPSVVPLPMLEAPADEEAEAAWASASDARAELLAVAQRQEQAKVDALASMFPEVDPLVCQLVLENCRGDFDQSTQKLLSMN